MLKQVLTGHKKHRYYEKSVEMAHSINVHMEGSFPGKLIDERRPSESEYIKKYRKEIWQPITQEPLGQVVNELMKIRKADDWSVRYDVSKFPSVIKKEETPTEFFEKYFPEFGSVTDWAFKVLLPVYLADPNAVIFVAPIIKTTSKEQYKKPFPFIFTAKQVWWFDSETVILHSREFEDDDEYAKKGDIFYTIDKQSAVKYTKADDGAYVIEDVWEHNLGYIPAFKLKALVKKHKGMDYLWKSRLETMIPRLNEAVREYSDLQAEVVQHVHSEKWVIETQNCTMCKGSGKTRQGNPVEIVDCPQCKGSGTVATSPYSNMVVKPVGLGEKQLPIPPAGYIQKQVEIVKIQDERVDKHIYKALCAVNMQYLDKSPVAQSGIAKEVDKDSLNNFVNGVAEDLVNIMDRFYAVSVDIRYGELVPSKEIREDLLPHITVPTKLDILSTSYLVDEVKRLKDSSVNPLVIIATETELANKKFASDPDIRDMLVCVYDLDPLAGFSQDDKMTMLQNRGIQREDYIVSCNIQRLVKQAMLKDKSFAQKTYEQKMQAIYALADPILKNVDPTTVDTNPPA